jgi:hypothetical protein
MCTVQTVLVVVEYYLISYYLMRCAVRSCIYSTVACKVPEGQCVSTCSQDGCDHSHGEHDQIQGEHD